MLTGLAQAPSQAGLKASSSGGTGAVLALAAQLRTARLRASAASSRTPGGRTLLPRRMMHSGTILKARAAAAASVVPISGGVQTYDVNNPPPAFRPLIGFGSAGALNNSSTNPPVYVGALSPTNLTPVWSADETFLVFSSNRTPAGGVNADGDGGGSRFHLWAISVNGGEAFQITTSTGPSSTFNPATGALVTAEGELFPALSRNNLALTFTSDAQSPGTQNLFALAFSYSTLSTGTVAPANLTPSTANPTPTASLTLRGATEAASAAQTGFDQVVRPTFSPGGDLLVFSARSISGTNGGHFHLYFLYQSSGGFSQNSNVSFPGKLTDGLADDTDPTFAPDGSYIAFASTANAAGFTRNPNNAFGPPNPASPQDPNASQSLSSGASATRSVFLISGGLSATGVPFGTVPGALSGTGGRVTRGGSAGFDDYGPAWSSFANQNQFTNPSGNFAYLAFARSTGGNAPHDIYYFQAITGVTQPTNETLTPETAAGGANASVKLNTDDNAGETTPAGNGFDDIYPTWSPFLSIFSIAYTSNRTVTYNSPASGAPVEMAASVGDGGAVTNTQDPTQNYSVGASYAGLLVSQVLNLDPPTLLRFSAGEVVHVQAVKTAGGVSDPVMGTPNKLAASGGQPIVLTVRLSDREAGIDDTGGPNGGPRVYIQIKDPDSKYQDAQGLEHKVFMKDRRYDLPSQTNRPATDTSSGTANGLLDVYNYALPTSDLYASTTSNGEREIPTYQRFLYPSYGNASTYDPMVGMDFVNGVFPRGTHGGQWLADTANNPNNTHLFVGKSALGTQNPAGQFSYPVMGGRATAQYPGTDPALFIPHGPEYECQVINPLFAANGATDATAANYVTPYYMAGIDDQGAFTGGTYNTATAKDRPNTEWLPLARVPAAQQDNNGGILYSVTWNTPNSGSDFYVDVIAYDKAAFPNLPGTPYVGLKTNWRIYDNVGGFSTNQSVGSNDILLVSDYALGQKFAATSFGGRNFNQNLVPKIFGTESYLTDVDINILPDSVYAGIPGAEADAMASAGPPPVPGRVAFQFSDVVQPFGDETVYSLFNFPGTPPGSYLNGNRPLVVSQNGLGVQSYIDTDINDGTSSTDGAPNVQSQRYSIWRILSRGPVPSSVLNSYLPTPVQQPAIVDAADPAYKNIPAAAVLDASRCVIWLSPYTGDVLADPGTIDDPGNVGSAGVTNPRQSTTSILTAFVQAGGRLCITGQDIGSTLTQGGTVGNTPSTVAGSPNFLPDVLNAMLVPNVSGGNVLAGSQNRITGSPFYDNTDTTIHGEYITLTGPIQGPNLIQGENENIPVPSFPYQDNLVIGDADYGDSGLSQIPALQLPGGFNAQGQAIGTVIQGQTDVLTAVNGAQAGMTYTSGPGGSAALVFHDDPYLGGTAGLAKGTAAGQLPNGGTGSRVVYAGFGLEGLSNDYYSPASPNPSAGPINPPNPLPLNEIIPAVIPRNVRAAVLHNIVSYLRSGRVSGTITQTSGTGQGGGLGIDGVTVYLRPILNPATGSTPATQTPFVPSTRAAFSALTASGGRFTIAGVEPGTYTLVAVKPGFQRAVSNNNVSFTVEGDVTKTNATLTMTPQQPGNIAGAVHDAAGNLISGSTVTFTSQDNSVTQSVTSQNGSVTGNAAENYFLQTVPVTTYTATASGPLNPQGLPEYTAATKPDGPGTTGGTDFSQGITVQSNTTVQPVNFTLTPILAAIKGTVTNGTASGPPVAGATVTLQDSTGKTVGTTTTAADGTYTLASIPVPTSPTTYTIVVTAPGFAASTPLPETVYLGSILTAPNVSLTPIAPGSIKVTVAYSTGGPVAGAIVTYKAPGATAAQTVTTGADGTVVIPSVPPATYTVTAVGPNNANGRATTLPAASQPVTVTSGQQATAAFVVVPIAPSFIGTVTSPGSPPASTPLAKATVTVTGTDATGAAITPITVKTDTNGKYTTGDLAPGRYTLTASLAGFTSSSTPAPITVQLGDAQTVQNFSLTSVAPGSITGIVSDNNGKPIARAVVTFNSTDGTVPTLTATTIADGSYVIPPPPATGTVPASTYTGTAVGPNNANGKPEYGAGTAQTVTVPPGGSGTANFTLPAILASVSGTVTDAQTSGAVAGATVMLSDPNGAVVGTQTTGTGGTYAFAGILTTENGQTYTLSVSKTGYAPATATITLSLGDALTQNVPLSEQATLFGLVTDGSANAPGQPPLPGVTLTVKDASGNTVATIPTPLTTGASAATGPDGKPENYLATLLPGTYTVTASKGSYTSQTSATITLTNAAPVRVNFALVSGIGTLGGLVTDQNGTGLVSGATVTAMPTGTTGTTGTPTGISFTTAASATPGPDGSPLNYTGQLPQGTYSVTVTKGSRTTAAKTVTVVGGAFTRLDFTAATGLPALHTFGAGFQFVSTPYDYSALGFDGLFGTLNTAPAGTTPNGNRSHVAVWNPLTGAYALDPTAPADSLRLGVGYWVYLKNAVPVTQQGATPPATPVSVSLGKGWNQIGVPNPSAAGIPVANLLFDNGAGGTITFAQASSPQYNLVIYSLYSYAGGGYQAVSSTGVLTPWNAYWIYVNAPATLEIPTR